MNELEQSSPRPLASWWRENRSWALPAGMWAVLLSLVAAASCAGAVLTFAFGTVRLGASLRKSRRRSDRSS